MIYDVDKKQRRALLERPYRQIYWGPAWSPDGAWICFKGVRPDGRPEVAAVSIDGEKKGFKIVLPDSATPEVDNCNRSLTWGGPSSQIIIAMRTKNDRVSQFYAYDFAGGQPPRLLPGFPTDWASGDATWSCDGKKVAFSARPALSQEIGTQQR
jgi:Tol biopolymer transport system component